MGSFGSSFAGAYNAVTAGRESGARTKLAWAQLAEQQEERDQRETAAGKAAEFFFKANPSALMELGLSETQFNNMSAQEQSAAALGYVQAQTQKQIYQQLAAEQAAQGVMQRASQQQTTMPSPSAPGVLPDLNVQTTGVPTAPRVWQELAANPAAMNAPAMQPFLRELAQSGGAQGGFSTGEMGVARPIAGVKGRYFVPVSTGSGQVIEDTAATDAANEYTADDFKFDADGNVTHWRMSGEQFIKWDPKMTLVPGSKKGTVRVVPPRAPNMLEQFFGQPAGTPEPAPATRQDITQAEYEKLKPGETYWFKGKQYTKK